MSIKVQVKSKLILNQVIKTLFLFYFIQKKAIGPIDTKEYVENNQLYKKDGRGYLRTVKLRISLTYNGLRASDIRVIKIIKKNNF